MARDVSDSTPIAGRRDLVAALEAGCKPAARHRRFVHRECFCRLIARSQEEPNAKGRVGWREPA